MKALGRDHLAIRVRRIVAGDGEASEAMTVYCAARNQSLPLSECETCEHCDGVAVDRSGRNSFVVCRRTAPPPGRATAWQHLAKGMFPSVANQTRIAQVMTTNVCCVMPEVSVEALTAMFIEKNISGAPVVDAEGHAIGMVSKTDLVRDHYERGDTRDEAPLRIRSRGLEIELGSGFHAERVARATVGEIMMPVAFTLEEDAPISHAAALMATEGVHHLPVVSADGKIVGMLSALDVLRWVASESGY